VGEEQPAQERLSLFMVEYRVTQLELLSKKNGDKMETLATKDDVAELKASLQRRETWWSEKLIAPALVGAVVVVFEAWVKAHP
jgi:hypothetical protein